MAIGPQDGKRGKETDAPTALEKLRLQPLGVEVARVAGYAPYDEQAFPH